MTLEEIEKYQYDQYIKECNRTNGCCGILMIVGIMVVAILVMMMFSPLVV